MTLSLDSMICQNSSQNLGKHLTFITLLSKKRRERVWMNTHRRATQGEVWKGAAYRSFCSSAVGVRHPLGTWMSSPAWQLPNPVL